MSYNLRVTGIIKAAGLMGQQWSDEWGMDRGTAVHKAAELDDRGDLDPETVDPMVAGHLAGWRKFRAEAAPEILAVEEEVIHEQYGYRGRLDRRVKLTGVEGILDIKCGQPAAWHPIQLAGYALTFHRPLARWGLYLPGDGNFRLREYRDRNDYDIFKAALTVARWLEANP